MNPYLMLLIPLKDPDALYDHQSPGPFCKRMACIHQGLCLYLMFKTNKQKKTSTSQNLVNSGVSFRDDSKHLRRLP